MKKMLAIAVIILAAITARAQTGTNAIQGQLSIIYQRGFDNWTYGGNLPNAGTFAFNVFNAARVGQTVNIPTGTWTQLSFSGIATAGLFVAVNVTPTNGAQGTIWLSSAANMTNSFPSIPPGKPCLMHLITNQVWGICTSTNAAYQSLQYNCFSAGSE